MEVLGMGYYYTDYTVIYIVALLINAGLAFIPAGIAKKKGYSYAGFWCLSFFLSFVVGLIVALLISDKTQPQIIVNQYPPYQQPGPQYYQANPQGQSQQAPAFCPQCGSPTAGDAAFCSKCGAKLT
jgi:hypothetical protein